MVLKQNKMNEEQIFWSTMVGIGLLIMFWLGYGYAQFELYMKNKNNGG